MIGVLGGMGPAATVDFLAKLVRLTPATRDQDHLPVVVMSDPRVPDRVAPILDGRGPSPLPAMQEGIRRLEGAGARCVAMPCHTAHFWYDQLAASAGVPILHIVDAALAALDPIAGGQNVGVLATAATLHAGFYQRRLERAGRRPIVPGTDLMTAAVLPAIALVKRDRAGEAAPLLTLAVGELRAAGADQVLLACTELPVALAAAADPPPCVDVTAALARRCIAWYRENRSD